MVRRQILLVDGTGLFYRSFYAIKGLTSRDGKPTNAVFGFVKAIHRLIDLWKPLYLAVAWDGGSPKERTQLLPEYKAQRPPMPEALHQQYPFVCEFLERACIPLIRQQEQEADDILATVADRSAREMDLTLIASTDKDLYQLVNQKVVIVSPGKDGTQVGPDGVWDRTGVKPEQVVEWLALTGDAVDNIPGVPGLGPKTAARLLGQFGCLPALWARLEEIGSARLREVLVAHRDTVERNLELVRLRRDLDGMPGWDAMEIKPESPERMDPFYERMDFHSLVRGSAQGELF